MEHKHIIIILLAIIVILAAGIGVALMSPAHSKQPTAIKITSNNTQYEDDASISVKLADSNRTSLSKEIVNITITDKDGKVVVDNVVKTDNNGSAKLELDLKKGTYQVNVTYQGNDNYTGNTTTQKLQIEEEAVEAETDNYDAGAFYSKQSERTIYTGEVQDAPDGHKWKHLGNNEWVKID